MIPIKPLRAFPWPASASYGHGRLQPVGPPPGSGTDLSHRSRVPRAQGKPVPADTSGELPSIGRRAIAASGRPLMRLIPRSFQNRLALLFGALALLVGVPTAVYVDHVYTDRLVRDRGEALNTLAATMASVLSQNLRERQREIEYLAELPALRNTPLDDQTLEPTLLGLQKSHPYYTWIGFADLTGEVKIATRGLLLGVSVAQRPWYVHGLKHRYVGDLHEAVLLAKHLPVQPGMGPVRFIDFATPVLDRNGEVKGVVAAHAHWNWAGQAVRTMAPQMTKADKTEVLIANGKDQVIYPQEFDARVSAPRPPVGQLFFVDGWQSDTDYVTASVPIEEVIADNPLHWRVVVRQPKQVALKDVDEIQHILIAAAFVAAVVFLVFAWWSASLISRPLRQLSLMAKRIQQGDETVSLELDTHSVELRRLSKAVTGMALTLIQRRNALAEANAGLERRVQERTAELERLNLELRSLARRDALTGLANRLAANERLREEHLRFKRSETPYAVLLLDIDYFKRINDTHGHAEGDAVLRHVGQVLRASIRESDFVARFGGEEFLVILPGTDQQSACLVGEKLRLAIESSPVAPMGVVTVSVGGALAMREFANEEDVVQHADRCLYEAKHAGRNRVAFTYASPATTP